MGISPCPEFRHYSHSFFALNNETALSYHRGRSPTLRPKSWKEVHRNEYRERRTMFANNLECIVPRKQFLSCCFLRLHQSLRQGRSLLETPWSNLSFKQFIKLGRRSSTHALVSSLARALELYVPSSLRNEEPDCDSERSTNASVEPTSLKAPVPILSVNHLWNH